MVIHTHNYRYVELDICDIWCSRDYSVRYWMLFRLVPGSSTEVSHECTAQGFAAHGRCSSSVLQWCIGCWEENQWHHIMSPVRFTCWCSAAGTLKTCSSPRNKWVSGLWSWEAVCARPEWRPLTRGKLSFQKAVRGDLEQGDVFVPLAQHAAAALG